MTMRKSKALIAMSGGVDSSVAAYLMQQIGYDCIGATMKLLTNPSCEGSSRTCCSLDDVEDARSVAYRLGIPYYVFNFSEDFKEQVIDRFVREYEAGLTPNPCIECNRHLKFERLYLRAKELSCDTIVTGHYARIIRRDDRYVLQKGIDEKKDQSYVLYSMTQEELAHTCFPLGEMTKEQIRKIAQEMQFSNAAKPDSQDICFVPDGDYVRFMEQYTGKVYPEGDFLDPDGAVLGRHQGAVRYTIGQRKGLGIAFGKPLYVQKKDMEANTVTLAENGQLFSDTLIAGEMNWIAVAGLSDPVRCSAKIRYKHKEQPAVVYPLDGGLVKVVFDEPQRAITPGQAVVLYDGDDVLGGGKILEA
ncbi:MAG: tRNA 2-thiouridine(34) synthase MnmA [Parasporobacterium sp.]|nr:tRNA 2-thiouridine(34) synthase MnmA [Parasporobacterium sp.]